MDELLGIFNSAVRLDPSMMGEEFNKDTSFNFSLPAGNKNKSKLSKCFEVRISEHVNCYYIGMDLPGSLTGSAASITAPKTSKLSAGAFPAFSRVH